MPGGEGDGLVVEEEERVVVRLPLLAPAAAELERADDPEVACVEADDLPAAVKDAAVAGPGAAQRDRLDVAQRGYAIATRCHSCTVDADLLRYSTKSND